MQDNLETLSFEQKFHWVKRIFEENDAGFQMVINKKGRMAYEVHNDVIEKRIKSAQNINECADIIRDWLKFFRKGHHRIYLANLTSTEPNDNQTHEYWKGDLAKFEEYIKSKTDFDYEGIWDIGGNYKIGIKKEENTYIGFIIESKYETWLPNMVKLKMEDLSGEIKSTCYLYDFSSEVSGAPNRLGDSVLHIGTFYMKRLFPACPTEPSIENYLRAITTAEPYIEDLNDNTLYFRIPIFYNPTAIEALVKDNFEKITQTENLIIDLRNNQGGLEGGIYPFFPILYTNPIKFMKWQVFASPLNNQKFLDDSIGKNTWGIQTNEQEMQWAKMVYDKLKDKEGEFITAWGEDTNVITFDEVHEFPKNIGIILNHGSASASEALALVAKQSRKAKIFGLPSRGLINTGGQYIVTSPCGEIKLEYSVCRDLQANDMLLDDIGVQPDFLIDSSVPEYKWVEHVNDIMQNWVTKPEIEKQNKI